MIEQTTTWVKGEVNQGRVMLFAGIVIAIACYFIWKSTDDFTRGMLIPLVLVALICLGYGSNLVWGRPTKLTELKSMFAENSTTTIQGEKERLQKEAQTYKMTKMTWAVLAIIGLGIYFFVSAAYYQGVGIGVLVFGGIALLTDVFLSHRVNEYLTQIQDL